MINWAWVEYRLTALALSPRMDEGYIQEQVFFDVRGWGINAE